MDRKESPGVRRLALRAKENRRMTKNMLPAVITIDAGENSGVSSVQGTDLIDKTCTEANLGHNRPGFLSMGVLEEDPSTLTGTPCMTEDETTVPIRWTVKKNQVVVDLYHVIRTIKFQVPAESRAIIPISARNVAGSGPSILFHFGQVTYEPIKRTGPRKKKAEKENTKTKAEGQAQDKQAETKS